MNPNHLHNPWAPQEFNYDTGSFVNLWWLPDVSGYILWLFILLIASGIYTWFYALDRNNGAGAMSSALEGSMVLMTWPLARIFAWCITPEHFRGLYHGATIVACIMINIIWWKICDHICEHYENKKAVWLRAHPDVDHGIQMEVPWYVTVRMWTRENGID
jgi:hypothetical protein